MSEQIRVCWISGSHFERQNAISRLKNMLGNFVCVICESDETGEEFEIEVLGNTLFDDNKLIVLRFIPKFAKAKTKEAQQNRLIKITSRIPHGNILVFDGIEPTEYPHLYKHINSIGKVIEKRCYLNTTETARWIKDEVKLLGKIIDDTEVSLLLEGMSFESNKGVNFDSLILLKAKLEAFLGKKKKIERADIIAISDTCHSYVIWDLLNAFDSKDYTRCMRLIGISCSLAKTSTEAIIDIFNFCAWRFKILLFAKESFARTQNQDVVVEKSQKMHKFSREGNQDQTNYKIKVGKSGELVPLFSIGMVKNLFKSYYGNSSTIDKYSIKDLVRIITCCEESLLMMRLDASESTAMLMIDNLYMTICNILPDSILSKIREISNA